MSDIEAKFKPYRVNGRNVSECQQQTLIEDYISFYENVFCETHSKPRLKIIIINSAVCDDSTEVWVKKNLLKRLIKIPLIDKSIYDNFQPIGTRNGRGLGQTANPDVLPHIKGKDFINLKIGEMESLKIVRHENILTDCDLPSTFAAIATSCNKLGEPRIISNTHSAGALILLFISTTNLNEFYKKLGFGDNAIILNFLEQDLFKGNPAFYTPQYFLDILDLPYDKFNYGTLTKEGKKLEDLHAEQPKNSAVFVVVNIDVAHSGNKFKGGYGFFFSLVNKLKKQHSLSVVQVDLEKQQGLEIEMPFILASKVITDSSAKLPISMNNILKTLLDVKFTPSFIIILTASSNIEVLLNAVQHKIHYVFDFKLKET